MTAPSGCPNKGCQARHTAQVPFDLAQVPQGVSVVVPPKYMVLRCGNCGLVFERQPSGLDGVWLGWHDSVLQKPGWVSPEDTE